MNYMTTCRQTPLAKILFSSEENLITGSFSQEVKLNPKSICLYLGMCLLQSEQNIELFVVTFKSGVTSAICIITFVFFVTFEFG